MNHEKHERYEKGKAMNRFFECFGYFVVVEVLKEVETAE